MHNIFLLVVISNDINVSELVNRQKLHPDKSSETNEVLMQATFHQMFKKEQSLRIHKIMFSFAKEASK